MSHLLTTYDPDPPSESDLTQVFLVSLFVFLGSLYSCQDKLQRYADVSTFSVLVSPPKKELFLLPIDPDHLAEQPSWRNKENVITVTAVKTRDDLNMLPGL